MPWNVAQAVVLFGSALLAIWVGATAFERQTVPGKRRVTIARLEPVGHYAVRIVFDDGHDTGLFTWVYLRELGEKHEEKWPAYLEALAQKGLSRD